MNDYYLHPVLYAIVAALAAARSRCRTRAAAPT